MSESYTRCNIENLWRANSKEAKAFGGEGGVRSNSRQPDERANRTGHQPTVHPDACSGGKRVRNHRCATVPYDDPDGQIPPEALPSVTGIAIKCAQILHYNATARPDRFAAVTGAGLPTFRLCGPARRFDTGRCHVLLITVNIEGSGPWLNERRPLQVRCILVALPRRGRRLR